MEVDLFHCPDCNSVIDYTLHKKGKAECCKYCVDCKEYKKPGDWWVYDEDGDHCPECGDAPCCDVCGEKTDEDDLYETEFPYVIEMLCKKCVSAPDCKGVSLRWEEEQDCVRDKEMYKTMEGGQLRFVESLREFYWVQDGLLYVYHMQTETRGALIGPWDGT